MLKNVGGIRIQGRCFEQETELKFFPKDKSRIALVYGRNGSGKSTIAKALSSVKNTAMNDGSVKISFIDREGNLIPNPEDFNVFVFDEEYIEQNIKVEDNGLQTILLVGEQVNLQKEIDEKSQKEEKLQAEFAENKQKLALYETKNGKSNPQTYWGNIGNKLREDGGWAATDADLKGNVQKTRVSDSTINDIACLAVDGNRNDIYSDFLKHKALYEKTAKETATEYSDKICPINFRMETETNILKLLAHRIEEPKLTQREEQIIETLNRGLGQFVSSAKDTFQKDDVHYCPYCYQPIDDDYRRVLLESIDKVLNVEVKEHQADLKAFSEELALGDFDYTKCKQIDEKIVGNICIKQKEYADIIKYYRDLIKTKIENCYAPLQVACKGLAQKISELNILLSELEKKRVDFNQAIQTRQKLKEKLLLMNKQLAYFDIKDDYSNYLNYSSEKSSLTVKCTNLKTELKVIRENIEDLKHKSANEHLAIDRINSALDYVFFSKGRLAIEINDGKYCLKSYGKDVLPKNISVGERNIIALCYFFTQMMENQKVEEFYALENFVVIDDPVSSFDFENRVGIISYLRYQAKQIITGNEKSKIAVFSHDLQTVFDLSKAGKEICGDSACSRFKLFNKGLEAWGNNNPNEYNQLLKRIYSFANGNSAEDTLIIGNIMRRVLEAFSTFSYRESIENVSINPNILEKLGEHSEFFENLMYRLVLHGESHYEERVKSGQDDYNFFQFISDDEKVKTAQNILCFIYFLNSPHLKTHFKEEGDALKKIEAWAKTIPVNKKP